MADDSTEQQSTGAPSAAADVFVSYASQDAAIATAVVEALERSGIACWIAPRDVMPGAFYADAIVHAIDAARAIVLILSRNAADSQHVLREVERAVSRRHPVVSLRVDKAPLPAALEYFLNTSHWLDASGGDVARSMPKLVVAARVAIQVPVGMPEAALTLQTSAPSQSAPPPWRTTFILASLIGLVIVGFAIDRLWFSGRGLNPTSAPILTPPAPATAPAGPTIPEKSVAVLPFVDMSEKKDQEYFSDGLSEELIDMLTKVPDLRVPARTSSFYFKGKQATITDIAKALGVSHVLEGSVRKSGNTLRITAQLIRVDTGYHVWSETYDRKLEDIFKIQDEISKSVVNSLKVSVLGTSIPRATPIPNHDAYLLYLQAKEFHNRGNSLDSTRKAVRYLRDAMNLDPEFLQGWITLASFLAADYNLFNIEPHDEVRAQIYSALDHARKLDPGLLTMHEVIGRVLYEVDWNWQAADSELRQAIELEPGNADAHRLAGYLATTLGRYDDAIVQSEKAMELDPLQPWNYIARGFAAYRSGRLAQAEANFRSALDLAPESGKFHCLLGAVLLTKGQRKPALAEMEKESDPRFRQVGMALALEALGERAESDKELKAAEQESGDEMGYWISTVYAARGDPDRAFAWLDRAFNAYGEGMTWIKGDPLLRSLTDDPRYKALLQKMRLPE